MNILSGDRDLFQLVDDQKDIYVLYMGGGPYAKSGNPTLMNENGVKEKLGVAPERVVDLKALTGDSSDNIPGIKGVGPKTQLIFLKRTTLLMESIRHWRRFSKTTIRNIKDSSKVQL